LLRTPSISIYPSIQYPSSRVSCVRLILHSGITRRRPLPTPLFSAVCPLL
jgi:hypothetical protein